jgi:hypothetical protein
MSDPRLNERTNERTQKGGTKGRKKQSITKKSNPIIKFNRTSEIQRRLEIERKRRRHEEGLKKLKNSNRNRLYEEHLKFIKDKINATRKKERNQGYRTENENQSSNHSSRNSTEYSYSKQSSSSSEPIKPINPVTSNPVTSNPVRPANRNQSFHELRQRMQEAASRASKPSNNKVHAPQSWRNYFRQKTGW